MSVVCYCLLWCIGGCYCRLSRMFVGVRCLWRAVVCCLVLFSVVVCWVVFVVCVVTWFDVFFFRCCVLFVVVAVG